MVLFFWGTLSDERTGLLFVYAAGPRQRSSSSLSKQSQNQSQNYVTTDGSVGQSVLE
jgi:hypothetical protein